jgi:hypothetical protein
MDLDERLDAFLLHDSVPVAHGTRVDAEPLRQCLVIRVGVQ